MAEIALRNIGKSFGDVIALSGINLDVKDGEFLTLVGPSGCGKSTLLRIIAGLEQQSEGDVEIDQKVVNHLRASKRDLAMVFQSYALYPHLSVEKNLATPLLLRDLTFSQRLPFIGRFMPGYGSKRRGLDEAVSHVAETLQIEHLMERKPGQLSGGQRQRVAVGRAMVRNPTAFLMDEPLSNLDAALRVHMRAELASLHRKLNTTFVYVTHDQAEALTMSDRMAVMMDGQILQLGAPHEIYQNPKDLRVAEFVGSPKMNILPAKIDSDNRVDVFGVCIKRKINPENKQILIGIRPEHVKCRAISETKEGWSYRITHKENMGADYYLHGVIDGFDETIVARTRPEEMPGVEIGDSIEITLASENCFAFTRDNNRVNFTDGIS